MKSMKNELYLNKNLYGKKSIQEARKAYGELADIQLDSRNEYWVCSFFQCVYGEERTMQEFENYLIGLTNQEREQNDDDM